jgi:hypothetical protein
MLNSPYGHEPFSVLFSLLILNGEFNVKPGKWLLDET